MESLEKVEFLPQTKDQVNVFVADIVNAIMDGEVDPLKTDVQLKIVEDAIGLIRKNKDVKAIVSNEADKYGGKTFTAFGAEITKFTRTQYDYSSCADSIWDELKEKEADIKDALKKRERLLQGIEIGGTIANTETGEIINAPDINQISGLQIKLK